MNLRAWQPWYPRTPGRYLYKLEPISFDRGLKAGQTLYEALSLIHSSLITTSRSLIYGSWIAQFAQGRKNSLYEICVNQVWYIFLWELHHSTANFKPDKSRMKSNRLIHDIRIPFEDIQLYPAHPMDILLSKHLCNAWFRVIRGC